MKHHSAIVLKGCGLIHV